MTYKCVECGNIFESGEEARWEESHGLEGAPYEEWYGCPVCKGGFEEAENCAVCGVVHIVSELNGGVCDDCIDKYRHNFKACYEIASEETETIKINSLLASLLDESDIEQILKEYIRDRMPDVDCSHYIDTDKAWFGERLAERGDN